VLAPAVLAGAHAPAAAQPGTAEAVTAVPTAAQPDAGPVCTITGGSLTWGFKESFRSYISGTIAKGAWEPVGGATYETPNFGWSGATGEIDPAALTGDVHFPGGVHFTGHNGLLDTTVAGPTLRFAGDGSGTLLLDLTNLSMDDAMAGNTENVQVLTQVPLVSLDLATAPVQASPDGVTFTGTAVPTAITAEGYEAFGSYETGTAFDPATFSFTVECPEPEPTAEPTAAASIDPTPAAAATSATSGHSTWVAWVGGAVGVVIVAAAITWIVLWQRVRARRAGSE
jgi:hypothetical protein